MLGLWLLLLMHRPRFRAWCLDTLCSGWKLLRQIVVELPTGLLRSPFVQLILRSQAYAAVRSYVLRPAMLTLLVWLPCRLFGSVWNRNQLFEAFLLAALFLNSPIGRYADEWLADLLARAWHELRMRVFGAIYQWIMDWFHRLLVALERIVYTVDELLRFRAGDNRLSQSVRLVAGTVWFFVAYVVVFVFTLLIEPQINPIKHFPVVTVSQS